MWKGPIVEEVRKHHLEIEAKCEHDFDKLFEKAIQTQTKLAKRLISKPAAKLQPEPTISESRS
ncbi:hypothetical protein GWN75_31460 [candidate division KSB1 bacterium]|nr:hypothetical protein [candidate division KSB1 bacterium]